MQRARLRDIVVRPAVWLALPLAALMSATPLLAQTSASKTPSIPPDPASAQPSLPKPMPEFTVPGSSLHARTTSTKLRSSPIHDASHRQIERVRHVDERLERPALANVELVEPLPHPPQPPHVVVPLPAYPFENFITYFTAPPPPVVCTPTRADRFKPDPQLVDQRPALCTADNP